MSTVRLWDHKHRHLASELECPEPTRHGHGLQLAIIGPGAIYNTVGLHMTNHPSENLYVTIDRDDKLDYRTRQGGVVERVDIDERLCECGQTRLLRTTLIIATGLPTVLAAEAGEFERLRAFARESVHHGDMTPAGARMLNRIVDELETR